MLTLATPFSGKYKLCSLENHRGKLRALKSEREGRRYLEEGDKTRMYRYMKRKLGTRNSSL